MPKNMTEHLEHRSNARVQEHEDARMDARMDAMEALWSEYEPSTKENLNLVVYGERRGGEDDLSQSNWNTLQDGLPRRSWATPNWPTSPGRPQTMPRRPSGKCWTATSPRATKDTTTSSWRKSTHWSPTSSTTPCRQSQTAPTGTRCRKTRTTSKTNGELANMARSDRWEEIPGRIREIHLNTQAQAVG